MKNLIYSSVLAAILALPAQAISSEISLSLANQQKFTLNFDNSIYTTPSTTYNVTNILAGNHHVRMLSVMGPMNGAYGMPQLLFDGWVNVPQNARVTAMPANLSQLNIISVMPLVQSWYNPYDPYGNNGYGNNNPYGYGNNDPYGNNNPYGNGYPNNGGCGSNNPYGTNYPNTGYGNQSPYPSWYGMSPENFSALKNSINAQSFDSSKLTVAKQAAASNNLTAAQVKELLGLMTFESTKLDLAKFAYGRTVDRGNYYQVSDAFTFSSSVSELSEYINNYHG